MMKSFVALMVLGFSCEVVFGGLVSDDFNRPNGSVGNGWTTFAAGANVFNQELRTYGSNRWAGGVARPFQLDPGQEYSFSFDFHTDSPLDGGWCIRLNSTLPEFDLPSGPGSNLARIWQGNGFGYVGGDGMVRYGNGTSWGVGILPEHARPITTTAHISGVLSPDLSATITIDYGDGGSIDQVSFPSPGIDPASVLQGQWLVLGNSNATYGPHYFDNFVVTPEPSTLLLLAVGGLVAAKRRRTSIVAAL